MTFLRALSLAACSVFIASCGESVPSEISGDIIWEQSPPLNNASFHSLHPIKEGKKQIGIRFSGTTIKRDPTTNNIKYNHFPTFMTLDADEKFTDIKVSDVIQKNAVASIKAKQSANPVMKIRNDIFKEKKLATIKSETFENGDFLLYTVSTTHKSSFPKNTVVLFRIKPDGEILWEHVIKSSDGFKSGQLIMLPDESFIITGRTEVRTGKTRPHTLYSLHVRRMSSSGEILWIQRHMDERRRYIYDTAELTNGYLIFAGIALATTPSFGRDRDGLMITPDGEPYVHDRSPASKSDMFALCLDRNTGDVIWNQTYAYFDKSKPTQQGNRSTGEEKVVAALRLKGDRILLAGSITGGQDTLTDFYLKVIEPTGEVFWDRRYGGSGIQILKAATLMPDGHVLLSGITSGPINRRYTSSRQFYTLEKTKMKPWILKVDMGEPKRKKSETR